MLLNRSHWVNFSRIGSSSGMKITFFLPGIRFPPEYLPFFVFLQSLFGKSKSGI
jgi:hypothetical protein